MLTAEFQDDAGNYYSPTDLKLKVFDVNLNVIEEGDPAAIALGRYYYYYTATEDDYMFEFSGIDPEGYPVAERFRLQTTKLFE